MKLSIRNLGVVQDPTQQPANDYVWYDDLLWLGYVESVVREADREREELSHLASEVVPGNEDESDWFEQESYELV
jgi:hypothetical protein